MPVYIDKSTATIGGNEYKVARSTVQKNGKNAPGPRQWKATPKPVASRRPHYHEMIRFGVRQGDIKGEWVMFENDWSGGVCGDLERELGLLHLGERVDATVPGKVRPLNQDTVTTNTNTEEGTAVESVLFKGAIYVARGRNLYKYVANAESLNKDFGTGVTITDIVVHNNLLLVCFGGSTTKIWTYDGTTWTQATDAVYADYWAKNVAGQLARVTATNQVSWINATDDATVLANWPAGISVGDSGFGATDLNGYGSELLVSKPEGLFRGDASNNFVNVLPQIAPMADQDNGRHTVVVDTDVYYPHQHGLLHYDGQRSDETGIEQVFNSADVTDRIPGVRICSQIAAGGNLWSATEPSRFPSANPTGVQFTSNTGGAYTDGTANMTDGDLTTTLAANINLTTNWLIVGYSAAFYGMYLEFATPSSAGATNPLQLQYWNGSAWTALPQIAGFLDRTTLVNAPGAALGLNQTAEAASGPLALSAFGRSGLILWSNQGLGTWAASTINGINAFWIRILAPGTISAGTTLAEVRVLPNEPRSYIWRGRKRQGKDSREHTIIWEPWAFVAGGGRIGAMIWSPGVYPSWRGGSLLAFSRNNTDAFRMPIDNIDVGIQKYTDGGRFTTRKLDGAMPEVLKHYTRAVFKGKTIDANHTFKVEYRLDTTSAWTTLSASVSTSPAVLTFPASTTGYTIQYRVTFNNFTSDTFPEVNEIETVFRELATYKLEHMIPLELLTGGQDTPTGGPDDEDAPNIDASAQVTAIEALVGTATTLTDELRRTPAKNVTFFEADEREERQENREYPDLYTMVRMVET